MNLRFTGRALTLATIFLLMLWLIFWFGFLTRADLQQRVTWLMLVLLPLMIVGYFLWRDREAAFVWSGFIALGYFAQGVTVVLTSKSDADYAAMEVFLSLLLFSAASATSRMRHRAR
jgi:uncharacterized membrane protein